MLRYSHLLVEDRLGLTSVSGLLPVVTPLTCSREHRQNQRIALRALFNWRIDSRHTARFELR